MKKSTIILLFLALSSKFLSQTKEPLDLGFYISPAISYRIIPNTNTDLKWLKERLDTTQTAIPVIHGGFFVRKGVSPKLALKVGISYLQQGVQFKSSYLENYTYLAQKQQVVSLPLGVDYSPFYNEKIKLLVGTDLYLGALVSSRMISQQLDAYKKSYAPAYPSSARLLVQGGVNVSCEMKLSPNYYFNSGIFWIQQLNAISNQGMAMKNFSTGMSISLIRRWQ